MFLIGILFLPLSVFAVDEKKLISSEKVLEKDVGLKDELPGGKSRPELDRKKDKNPKKRIIKKVGKTIAVGAAGNKISNGVRERLDEE